MWEEEGEASAKFSSLPAASTSSDGVIEALAFFSSVPSWIV